MEQNGRMEVLTELGIFISCIQGVVALVLYPWMSSRARDYLMKAEVRRRTSCSAQPAGNMPIRKKIFGRDLNEKTRNIILVP